MRPGRPKAPVNSASTHEMAKTSQTRPNQRDREREKGMEGWREGGQAYLGVLVVGVLPSLGQKTIIPKDRAVVITGARREGGRKGEREDKFSVEVKNKFDGMHYG